PDPPEPDHPELPPGQLTPDESGPAPGPHLEVAVRDAPARRDHQADRQLDGGGGVEAGRADVLRAGRRGDQDAALGGGGDIEVGTACAGLGDQAQLRQPVKHVGLQRRPLAVRHDDLGVADPLDDLVHRAEGRGVDYDLATLAQAPKDLRAAVGVVVIVWNDESDRHHTPPQRSGQYAVGSGVVSTICLLPSAYYAVVATPATTG